MMTGFFGAGGDGSNSGVVAEGRGMFFNINMCLCLDWEGTRTAASGSELSPAGGACAASGTHIIAARTQETMAVAVILCFLSVIFPCVLPPLAFSLAVVS
jgi:hypothetical protein